MQLWQKHKSAVLLGNSVVESKMQLTDIAPFHTT